MMVYSLLMAALGYQKPLNGNCWYFFILSLIHVNIPCIIVYMDNVLTHCTMIDFLVCNSWMYFKEYVHTMYVCTYIQYVQFICLPVCMYAPYIHIQWQSVKVGYPPFILSDITSPMSTMVSMYTTIPTPLPTAT